MAGVQVDRDTLSRMSNAFAQTMAGPRTRDTGHRRAPLQRRLGQATRRNPVRRNGRARGEKGKTGAYATGADVLEDITTLEDQHPQGARLAARILDWRQIAKLKSTYTDTLQDHINPDTGRVHTSYSIAGANTGRLASTDPNLQNNPRPHRGKAAASARLRRAQGPHPRQPRLLPDRTAHPRPHRRHPRAETGVPRRHRHPCDDASEMFNVPLDQMTPDIRRAPRPSTSASSTASRASALPATCASPVRKHRPSSTATSNASPHPRLHGRDRVKFAQANGHVETLFGRKIHTPDINAKGPAQASQDVPPSTPPSRAPPDVIRRP